MNPYATRAYAWKGHIVHVGQDSPNTIAIGLFNITTKKDSTLNKTASPGVETNAGYVIPYSNAFSGSKLFFIHAKHPDFPGSNLFYYDLESGLWSKELNLPGNVLENGAVVSNGKLYVITRSQYQYMGDSAGIFELDLATHIWAPKKRRIFLSLVALININETIFLTNIINGPFTTGIETYNPITDTWSSMPTPQRLAQILSAQLVGLNNKVYTLGGYVDNVDNHTTSVNSTQVDVYNPAQNSWAPAPNYLLARGYPGLVSLGTSIYIVSGQTQSNDITPTVEEYHPE